MHGSAEEGRQASRGTSGLDRVREAGRCPSCLRVVSGPEGK